MVFYCKRNTNYVNQRGPSLVLPYLKKQICMSLPFIQNRFSFHSKSLKSFCKILAAENNMFVSLWTRKFYFYKI